MKELTFSDIESADIYSINEHDGEKTIKIEGYFYCEDGFRLLTLGFAEYPLKYFLDAINDEDWLDDVVYSIHKQWIADFDTEEQTMDAFRNFSDGVQPTPLHFNSLTMDTPCGCYICIEG